MSAASVPIADDDGVLGVLNVGSRSFHARFSRSHVRAVETVGRSAALALRNARAAQSSQDLFFDSLKALALALETRDPYSNGGTTRVVCLAVALGERLDLSDDDAQALKLASLLHDIGMSAAGEAVAGVSRPLTTVEWGMLKMHPRIATEVLAKAPALQAIIPIVFHHHEHFDGTGYLGGVSGDEIPLGARILCGRRRLRRDDFGPPVPRGDEPGGGHRRADGERGDPVRSRRGGRAPGPGGAAARAVRDARELARLACERDARRNTNGRLVGRPFDMSL